MTTSQMKTWIRALRIPWTVLTLASDMPQMVRLERWHYPRRPLPFDEEEFDVQDPRFRRWLEANTGPIEEVD